MDEQTYYYYYRDPSNKPRVTVCLIEANGDMARGMAVCSYLDIPCKKTGRKIARQRAIHALKTMADNCPVFNPIAHSILSNCGAKYSTKSSYCPHLTGYEKKLIWGRRKRLWGRRKR